MLEKLSFIMDGVKCILDAVVDYVKNPPWLRDFIQPGVIDAPCRYKIYRSRFDSVRAFNEYIHQRENDKVDFGENFGENVKRLYKK